MSRTFQQRRNSIVKPSKSVQSILYEFLHVYEIIYVYIQVSFEFDMVMKKAESKEKFDRKWELWCPAICNTQRWLALWIKEYC